MKKVKYTRLITNNGINCDGCVFKAVKTTECNRPKSINFVTFPCMEYKTGVGMVNYIFKPMFIKIKLL